MNFNLLDEEWIPVLYRNGRYERVGIQTALQQAGEIRQIAATNPMDRVALLRFLMAVLIWCKGTPTDRDLQSAEAGLPTEWFTKFYEHQDCFNLFGDGKRFFQNSAYRNHAAKHTANYLLHEVPTGTNKWHFRHSTDMEDGLCPACCAIGLIRLPAFATSGGKGMSATTGKSPGINSKPPIYCFELGNTLAETLRYSWKLADEDLGTPEWETPNTKLPLDGKSPLLLGLTWMPRSVWLSDPEPSETPCISCGAIGPLVRRCVFDGKGSAKAEAREWYDPYVLHTVDSKGEVYPLHAVDPIGAPDAGAGHWTKILKGVLSTRNNAWARRLWLVGFSSVQNDKYVEAVEAYLAFNPAGEVIGDAPTKIDAWTKKTNKELQRSLRPYDEDAKSRRHPEIASAIASIRPQAEAAVSAAVCRRTPDSDEAWTLAGEQYRPLLHTLAASLAPGATVKALKRRRQIIRAQPSMSGPSTPDKTGKSRRKKKE